MSKIKFSDYSKPQYSVSRSLADTGVFDSELSQSLYGTTLDRFFSKTEIARHVGKIGRTSYELPCDGSYIQEADPYNQANQLQVVVHAPIGAEDKFMTFKDFMGRLSALGVDIRKFQQWGKLEAFNYVPPVNLDKFANYSDYYWCPPTPNLAPEYITIANPTRQVDDKIVHLYSRNADFVGAVAPTNAAVGTVWFDTTAIALKRLLADGTWDTVESLAYQVIDVNTIARSLIVTGDVSSRLQDGALIFVEASTTINSPARLIQVSDVVYDEINRRSEIFLQYAGDMGDLRNRSIFIDPTLQIVLSERDNYTEPQLEGFRVRPTTPFVYSDLPDIIWAKYTSLMHSTKGSTALGSIEFLESSTDFARFVDRGVRAGDFLQIQEQPNRGLYEIDTIVGDLTLSTIMPNRVGSFFNQADIDYNIIRKRALVDITSKTPPLSPILGEYWVDTDANVLRQYFPDPDVDPDTCPNLDQVWVPVVYNFMALVGLLGSRYISNYYPATNPWSEGNWWRHRSAVNSLGLTDARQAQLPIIEFNDGLELSSWRKTVHGWSYRSTTRDAYKPIDASPTLNELQQFDVYNPETLNQLSLGGTYGDRTANFKAGTRFRITDSIGGQLDGVYEVERSLFARYSATEFRTQIILKESTPLRAVFSLPEGRIVPVVTSQGDDWNGYNSHWRYDGVKSVLMTAPHQLSVKHQASNNTIRTFTQGDLSVKVALAFQEYKANVATTLTSLDIAAELLERAPYNQISNNTLVYINGKRITAYSDVESATSGGYVGGVFFDTALTLAAGDVVRVELGPVTNEDLGRTHVPVFNGTDVEFIDLTEYKIVPQVKLELNQYPLFSVYNALQQPVDRASTLFEYDTDEVAGEFVFWLQRRLSKTADGAYQFRLTLQEEGNNELFACKDISVRYTEQNDSALRSVWYSNPSAPYFATPEFVDRCGRPVCILDENFELNPEGFWQVPEFWTTNLVNETRTLLGNDALTAHFRSIIAAQTTTNLPPEEREVFFINSAPNFGAGGTIKLFNYGAGLTISTLMMEQTDPIDVIENAHDAYERLTLGIVERMRKVFSEHYGSFVGASRDAVITNIVDQTLASFENNDELNRVYGDSFNSAGLKNFVDTLPAFGLARYVSPQIIDVQGQERLIHHDGHVSDLTFNIASVRNLLINLIRTKIPRATKYLSPNGAVSPSIFPRKGNGSLVAIYIQPEYQTTTNGTTPPTLSEPTIVVRRETHLANGVVVFNTYTPTAYTIVNPERIASPDNLLVFDPAVGTWKETVATDLYIELEKAMRLEIEQRLYDVQSVNAAQYNTQVVVPDTNYSRLEQERFNQWLFTNSVTNAYDSVFKQDDPFTWNYIGGVVRRFPQLATSVMFANWQSIYDHFYGTAYPHVEPWKLQNYRSKPGWWDEEYKDTTGTRRWTEQMWFNIVFGIIPVGKTGPNGVSVSTIEDQQLVAGYSYIPVNTTDTAIVVTDTYVSATPQVYAPDDVLPPYVDMTGNTNVPTWIRSLFGKNQLTGLPETSFPNREAGYTFGVRGPREWEWRQSSSYLYDQLIVAWQIDPIHFTFSMMGFPITTIGRVHVDSATRSIHNHTITQFHGDYDGTTTDVVQINGLGQWYVNYFRAIHHDVTDGDFRRLWTTWMPHLGYMFNRVVNEDTIQLTSPTAEIVSGDYSIRVKETRELDILEHAGLRIQVLNAPSKYSPLRSSGKGWEFSVSSFSPFTNDITARETQNYFVAPGGTSGTEAARWYVNRFDIVGVNRYTPHMYQVVNYMGGWRSYNYLTSINQGVHTFVVSYNTGMSTIPLTITVNGSDPVNRTVGGLIATMNEGLRDSAGMPVGTFALRNGNIVLYAYNRNVVGRLTISSTTPFFAGIAPIDPTTGTAFGYYAGIDAPVSGDSQEQTIISVRGNRSLVIEPGDPVILTGTQGDGTYAVDEVRYDFVSGNTDLIFRSDMPLALIAEGQAIRGTTLDNWNVGDEVYFSTDEVLPSPLSESTPYFVAHVELFANSSQVNYMLLSTSAQRAREVAGHIENGASPYNMSSSHIIRANNTGVGELRLGKVASTFQALQGQVTEQYWKRHVLSDTARTFTGPLTITGIQSLIDFVHGYEAHGQDLGFVFTLENETNSDPVTGRMRGWQLELERFVSSLFRQQFTNIEMDNSYGVRFIDPTTLVFTNNAPTQWLTALPIRLSREDGNLPQIISQASTPSYAQTVFYIIPDNTRRNAFKLAFSASDAQAGNYITFDVPLYQSGADTAPYVETVTVPASAVVVEHNKSEDDLTKLIITHNVVGANGAQQPQRVMVTSSNALTFVYSEPVTGTISVAYAPTVYPSHHETLAQPALATSNSEYALRQFDVKHNLNDIDVTRFLITYRTVSILSGQPVAARFVNAVDANTLRFVFDEPPEGDITINVRPNIREMGGRLTARVIQFVPGFEGVINPYATGMWIATPRGIIRDVFENAPYAGALRTLVYDQYGVSHDPDGLLVLRQDRLTRMVLDEQIRNERDRTINADGQYANPRTIAGARIVLSGVEHAMMMNDTAVDGSVIYDSFVGAPSTLLYIEFEGQVAQTFRTNMGGYVMFDGKLVRSVEGMIEDLRYAYDTHEASEGSALTAEVRKSIGYDGQVDFLVDNNINKKSQFLWWKSMINHKGTHVPLQAFLKGVDVKNIIVDEFWAYELAKFGSAGEKTYPEMKLTVADSVAEEFRAEFLLPQETVVADQFNGIRLTDAARWHNQPDVVANHPYEAFFLNAVVKHIDDKPNFAAVSTGVVYYIAPQDCDGLILFSPQADGTTESYTVGSDIEKLNNRLYRVNVGLEDTNFFNTAIIALIGIGVDEQSVASLVDRSAGVVVDRISMWDPARGVYDQQGLAAVDVQSTTDPALYNQSLILEEQQLTTPSASPWLGSAVGRTWLDTSRVSYVPYADDRIFPVIEDRTRQWGALEPWAGIDLYEWTESDVPPELWAEMVRRGRGDSDSQYTGMPYSIRYARDVTGWNAQGHKHETHTPLLLMLNQIARNNSVTGVIEKTGLDTVTGITYYRVRMLPTLHLVEGLEIGATMYGVGTNSTSIDGDDYGIPFTIQRITKDENDPNLWTVFVDEDVDETLLNSDAVFSTSVAIAPFPAVEFEDTDQVSIYVNGVYEQTVPRPLVFDALFNIPRDEAFMSSQVSLVRQQPTVTRSQFTRGDVTEVFPYSSTTFQDELTGQISTKYYFWIREKSVNTHPSRKISISQAAKLLRQTARPYMIWQDLRTEEEGYGIVWGNVFDQLQYGLPGRYRQMIVRGLTGRVTENNRYVMRFTRDFTLRDRPDGRLKNLHSEWKLFRQEQTYKIDDALWNAATEALIGHKIGSTEVLVPSLNRVLYDQLNGAATRFGLGSGQAFVDQALGLNTVVYHIVNENGPFSGFGGVEFMGRYDLTDSSSIEELMGDIYAGCTVEQVNYLFFELLQDAIASKREYEKLFKTSWVSLQIVRDLDASSLSPIVHDRPLNCPLVPTTTTTTIPPAPIDDVDVVGCATFTTTTTTNAPNPISILGELPCFPCINGTEYYAELDLIGGNGDYASVDVLSGDLPSWVNVEIVGTQVIVSGIVEGCGGCDPTDRELEEGDDRETEDGDCRSLEGTSTTTTTTTPAPDIEVSGFAWHEAPTIVTGFISIDPE